MEEVGLYDYVLCNDNLEVAAQLLLAVAQRAVSGQTGNGIATMPLTLVQEPPAQVKPSSLLCVMQF